MGKKKEIKEKMVSVKLEISVVEEIDRYADKYHLNRSQLLRNMIYTGLDDMKLLEKAGLLMLIVKGHDLLSIVKKAIIKKKFKVEENDKLIIDL